MRKHATSSVFLFTQGGNGWRIGLIHHPRLHRWMLPGGHVEPAENAAEAGLREVAEETGRSARLINTHVGELAGALAGVPVPVWIVEQQVPAERRHPHPHIHVDHLYLAITGDDQPSGPVELPFDWFGADSLATLDMFDDSRHGAQLLFNRIDYLVAGLPVPPASSLQELGA